MSGVSQQLVELNARQVHRDSEVITEHPLQLVTPAPQWSYAVWFDLSDGTISAPPGADVVVTATFAVTSGLIGIGWTRAGSDDFVVERYFHPAQAASAALRVPRDAFPGRLMFRNASPAGRSHVTVTRVAASIERHVDPPYPVSIAHLERAHVGDADGPAQAVFDASGALSINQARLDFLEELALPVGGRRVLDAGCGVGHHTPFYTSRGCDVVGIDGRADNIAAMRRLYPEVEGIVGDLQEMSFDALGTFDIVHCFGLLYHLESPIAVLRRLARVCREVLLLETMVCDAASPVMVLADESSSANQALGGLGCRPSPSFVAMALDRLGFDRVYGTSAPPRHPDFRIDWKGNMDTARDGHNLRCMFVASRGRLESSNLVPLLRAD